MSGIDKFTLMMISISLGIMPFVLILIIWTSISPNSFDNFIQWLNK